MMSMAVTCWRRAAVGRVSMAGRLALLLGVLLVVSGCQHSPMFYQGREVAQARFEAGDFAAAALQWAVVAASETGAVDVRINAAQAFLQADDIGQAMLWYRRAQALDPRHSAVQLGLALVRALRVDILGDEPGVLPAIERLSVEVVSMPELAWLTLLAWSAAFVLGTLMLWRPRVKWAALTCAIVAALLLVLLMGRDLSQRTAPSAVVTAFETLLLSEPHSEGVALSRVYAAAEVRVEETRDEWVLVMLPDGRAGWLPADDVTLVREP